MVSNGYDFGWMVERFRDDWLHWIFSTGNGWWRTIERI